VVTSAAIILLVLPSFSGKLEGRSPAARAPFVSSVEYRRAVALDLAGRYREALAHYEAAGREPRAARARYHVELSRGVLESLDHLRRFPQDGRVHFRLGVDAANKLTALVRETGVMPAAFHHLAELAFRKAERLLPALADPTICLAGLYADAGEHGKARAAIARISGRVLAPGERYNLACYYHSMGQYDEALRELGKVMNAYYRKWIASSDDFWRLRGDPRFERLMRPGANEEIIR
jgi:tetratricopeptide (TPR) repeat protein